MPTARQNPADHEVAPNIANRWSPVSFVPEDPGDEAILSILEAARWAASSFNEQPWRFLIARRADTERFEAMLGCLVEGNREWARHAGLLVIVCARRNFSHNEKANGHARFDTGQAVAHMLLQAAELELQGHAMGGIEVEGIRETYSVDDAHDVICAIAFGKVADGSLLDADTAARDRNPRKRRSLSEIVFADSLGTPWR